MTDHGLARVSTLDQDPGLQLDALARAGCDRILEEKVSGVAAKRPVRDQVLAQLKAGDTLTVWDLSRLGRSMIEVVSIVEELEARGVRFRTIMHPIDTSSPTGKLQLQLLAAVAEYERRMIIERVRAGKARMLAEGRHPGGRALFGFERDHVTVNEDQAQLLRDAVQALDQGQTLSNVVDRWNAQGLAPGEASHWRVTHLRRILSNERVLPIIGQDAYDRLRRLFGDQERRKGGRPAAFLLSGILVHERCGRPMYGARRTRQSGQEVVYRCEAGKGSGGRHSGCGGASVAADRADEWAEIMFITAVAGPEFAQALNRRQAELLDTGTAEDLDAWRDELLDLEQVQGTRFYTDQMKRRHQELRRMTDQATARLMAQPDLQELMSLPRAEDELRAAWESWSLETRRTWIKRLVEKIVVAPAQGQGQATDRLHPAWKI
jgi:DNA invertase Pin-like site-specific DNA recombinase